MIPRMQLFQHDPQQNVIGDCFRAALASILNMKIESVPHFAAEEAADPSMDFIHRVDEFLADCGLVRIELRFPPNLGLGLILNLVGSWNRGICYIVSGTCKNGFNHAVLACDGEIIHDSNPEKVGIVGPLDSGYYEVMFVGSAIGERWRSHPPRRRGKR